MSKEENEKTKIEWRDEDVCRGGNLYSGEVEQSDEIIYRVG